MVGAKSLGCLECKRRKVKCDQRYPTCRNCERLGRSCSSPKSHFIRFVRPGAEEHIDAAIISTRQKSKSPSFIYPSSTVFEELSTDLIRNLRNIDRVGYQLQWFGVFVSFLPRRIGHNKALDAAVRCLLQAHHAMLCDKDVHTEGLESYNKSIALIRKDLHDQQAKTTSETVCAALILSTYEVYKREQCQSWMTHAGGVAAILQSWGPDRFVSDFELALFASHYGSTISSAILSGKPCFLAAPEWLAVICRCYKAFPNLDKYAMDCMIAFSTLPTLLCDIKNAKAESKPPVFTRSHLQAAREFKEKVSKHSLKFHLDFQLPTIVHTIHPSTSEPVLDFSTPSIAFRYNFYWAITIIANKILLDFGEPAEDLMKESEEAARNTCMSLEYLNGLKPLGALWLTFVAAMAFGVVGEREEERRRILEALKGCYHVVPVEYRELVLGKTFELLTGGG